MKKVENQMSNNATLNKESKQYTIDELIKMGKERNSIKLAKPLYEKEQNEKVDTVDK